MPATTRLGDVMKVLVVGAGAIGAYFGARLLEAGVDATFWCGRSASLSFGRVCPYEAPKATSGWTSTTVTAERLQKGFGSSC